MTFRHIGTLGAVGETMVLFGLALLWTRRTQAAEWLREIFDIWRGHVSGRDPHLADPVYRRLRPRTPSNIAWLVGAASLVVIGQILFLIDWKF